jgi:hypothetical protein
MECDGQAQFPIDQLPSELTMLILEQIDIEWHPSVFCASKSLFEMGKRLGERFHRKILAQKLPVIYQSLNEDKSTRSDWLDRYLTYGR